MSSSKNTHRRLLHVSAAGLCKEAGFQCASKASLETLTELLQAYLTQLTQSCRNFCEHSHRTTPDLTDVKMALAEVGSSAHAVHIYLKSIRCQPLKNIGVSKPPVEHKTLKSGLPKVNQPSYIPNHFPEYPEVHSFVRTPTLREPVNRYQTVRERVATQRKATGESLVKFLAQTNPTDVVLFENVNPNLYPAARIGFDPYPYYKGLIPSRNDVMELEGNSNELKSEDEDSLDGPQIPNSQNSQNSVSTNSSAADNSFLRQPKRTKLKK